jgi:CubicO group peptidase (beta-lactamase class C family)
VLLARATGSSVAELLGEHVTGPLGLADTGFTAAPARLPTMYGLGPDDRVRPLEVADRFAVPPAFESLACGLAATVGDYLEVLGVLVDGGPVLSAESVRLMTTDHLTAPQRASAEGFLGPGCGYGFQVEVRPGGMVGWAGGLGTIGYVARGTGRSAAVFTTQSFDVPGTAEALETVWTLLR